MEDNRPDINELRAEFFAHTRRFMLPLYGGSAVLAVALGVPALIDDAPSALISMVGSAVVMLALAGLGTLIPIPPSAARGLLIVGVVVGAGFPWFVDLARFDRAVLLGVCSGAALGLLVGTVLIRRRLAHDDALLERQMKLGYDPSDPWSLLKRQKGPRGS